MNGIHGEVDVFDPKRADFDVYGPVFKQRSPRSLIFTAKMRIADLGGLDLTV
jgi:hypothetical protein